MKLPPSLAPWESSLDLFPKELIEPLGTIARPLDALIGSLRDRRRVGEGEPDGYSNITRRGNYERLLLSEWLLATEEPEEWTRRAVSGELSFLEISRREPVAGRLCAALFDTGPSQWGSARLAHLVALIVLHRRALAAGARFVWGILQEAPPAPEAVLWSDVTETGVLRLTRGVALREVGEGDIIGWRDRLAMNGTLQRNENLPDLWVVGSGRLASLARRYRANLLTISEPADPFLDEESAPFLIANARFGPETGPRAVAQDVHLPLPPPSVTLRLLRDPFGARRHEAAATDTDETIWDIPASELIFSLHGSKVLARGSAAGGNTLLAYAFGNSPAASFHAPPKLFRSQYSVPFFAAGRVGKVTMVASLTPDGAAVRIEVFGKGRGLQNTTFPLTTEVKTEDGDSSLLVAKERLMPIIPLYNSGKGPAISELITILPDGRLVRLRHADLQAPAKGIVLGLRCLSLHRASSGVRLVGVTGRAVVHFMIHDSPLADGRTLERVESLMERQNGGLAEMTRLTAFCGIRNHDPLALLEDPYARSVRLAVDGRQINLPLPDGWRMFGVEYDLADRKAAYLYLLADDLMTVAMIHSSKPHTLNVLFRWSGPGINRIVFSPYASLIALATHSGEVAVWSLKCKDYVYRRVTASVEAKVSL